MRLPHTRARVSPDVDAGHHAVVPVLEIVAMEQVASSIAAPPHDHFYLFTVVNGDGVFPPLSCRRVAPLRSGSAFGRREMSVTGCSIVNPTNPRLSERQFDVVQPGIRVDSPGVQRLAIDDPMDSGRHPSVGFPPNTKGSTPTGLCRAERLDFAERSGTRLSSFACEPRRPHDGPGRPSPRRFSSTTRLPGG